MVSTFLQWTADGLFASFAVEYVMAATAGRSSTCASFRWQAHGSMAIYVGAVALIAAKAMAKGR